MLALINVIVYDIPFLTQGMATLDQASNADQGPPFFMVILEFAFDVLAFVAAYGTWQAQRWGVILIILVSAFNSINVALAAIFAPWMVTRILAAVSVVLYLGVIYLCLRREPTSLAKYV